jgi:hypothetical protein
MKNKVVILLVMLCAVKLNAQNVLSSNTYIQTKYHHASCFSVNNSSYLFYDESKQYLFLKIDFSKFKSGQDSLDEWLDDLSSTFFYFKAPVEKEIFQSGFANHHIKAIKLKGQAYLNGVWHNLDLELSVYSVENSLTASTTGYDSYENIRANFSLAIMPKDFKVHKKPHHLKKIIHIGVTLGRINVLQPSMEKLLNEVYDHH